MIAEGIKTYFFVGFLALNIMKIFTFLIYIFDSVGGGGWKPKWVSYDNCQVQGVSKVFKKRIFTVWQYKYLIIYFIFA